MKINKKLEIVWLCWFSNQQMMDFFKNTKIKVFAPWINNLIELFRNKNDITLHIIAPNLYNNKNICFEVDGIFYHFYKFRFILPRIIYNRLKINEYTNYYFVKNNVKKIILTIQPDLIHLHGSENPIYSSSVIPLLDQYKILLTIQGFVTQDTNSNHPDLLYRKNIEKIILEKIKYFGVRTHESCRTINLFNPNAVFFWHNYPITKPAIECSISEIITKEYDCVFFARLSPENGIIDLFQALGILKAQNINIRLLVVGPVQMEMDYLLGTCADLNIIENVTFKGFFETQQEVFKEVSRAKVDVLPTHFDIIPGTILECMYIGVPVIAYAVGGIPELNKDRESVALVQKGNIEELASTILKVLGNNDLRNNLALNAKKTAIQYFDNEKIYTDLLRIYHELVHLS